MLLEHRWLCGPSSISGVASRRFIYLQSRDRPGEVGGRRLRPVHLRAGILAAGRADCWRQPFHAAPGPAGDLPGDRRRGGERLARINLRMQEYLDQGLLVPHEGIFYIERLVWQTSAAGVSCCAWTWKNTIFSKGSQSLIRATEGTIIERLPPRMKIRENAVLEIPHIIVLIDDPRAHGDRAAGEPGRPGDRTAGRAL